MHFAQFFPEIDAHVRENEVFAGTFARCWKFGQADEAPNSARFDALLEFVKTGAANSPG